MKILETMKVGEKTWALESLINSAWSVSAILSRKQQKTPSFEIRSLHRTLSAIITHMHSSLPYSNMFLPEKVYMSIHDDPSMLQTISMGLISWGFRRGKKQITFNYVNLTLTFLFIKTSVSLCWILCEK